MSLLLALTAPTGQVEVSWLEVTAALMQRLMMNSSGQFEYGYVGPSNLVFLNTSGAFRSGASAGGGDTELVLDAGGVVTAP